MTTQAFMDFLRAEMVRREFESQRAFARWLGLSQATLWQVMDGGREPGLEFMIAVSRATGVGIRELVELAYPNTLPAGRVSADSTILAQQIEQLPDDVRTVVRSIIRGTVKRNTPENGE